MRMGPAVPSASGGRPMPPHFTPILPPEIQGQQRCGPVRNGTSEEGKSQIKGLTRSAWVTAGEM
jgi:hypothetical protein